MGYCVWVGMPETSQTETYIREGYVRKGLKSISKPKHLGSDQRLDLEYTRNRDIKIEGLC